MKKVIAVMLMAACVCLNAEEPKDVIKEPTLPELQKALLAAPTVNLGEQTFELVIRNAAILLNQKAEAILVEKNNLQVQIAAKEKQIKNILNDVDSGQKQKEKKRSSTNLPTRTRGEIKTEAIAKELNALKIQAQALDAKFTPIKDEYSALRVRYSESLNAQIAALKNKKPEDLPITAIR
jgi:hypothetical protein